MRCGVFLAHCFLLVVGCLLLVVLVDFDFDMILIWSDLFCTDFEFDLICIELILFDLM